MSVSGKDATHGMCAGSYYRFSHGKVFIYFQWVITICYRIEYLWIDADVKVLYIFRQFFHFLTSCEEYIL